MPGSVIRRIVSNLTAQVIIYYLNQATGNLLFFIFRHQAIALSGGFF
ncbi:MAG: hypothetical protein RRY34_10615 [Victivallaceae bacterium]